MKALVLGGTGPSGPHVVDGLLQRGYEVTIMHSGQHEVSLSAPVEHIHADVHFPETLRAGLGSHTFDLVVAAYGRLRVTAEVMVGRTERLISIGAAIAPAVSYSRGLGPDALEPLVAVTEDYVLPIDPQRDRFAHLVVTAEQSVMEHHRAGHYSATHFRLPVFYGPRQGGSTDWSIVRRILDGRRQLIIADGGLKLESRVFGANAAHGILLAVDQPTMSAGQTYLCADERTLTLKERIDLIARALDHEWELVSMPYAYAAPFHPVVAAALNHIVYDTGKIKRELGYRDVVPACEAHKVAARWLVENRPEPNGELERQLNDPFDYDAEDAMIKAYKEGLTAVSAVNLRKFEPVHQYRHPKQPNETWRAPEDSWLRR